MIEIHLPHLTSEDILKKIESEVEKMDAIPSPVQSKNPSPKPSHPLHVKPDVYVMSDFTNYYDEAFIHNAYKLIFGREPDASGKNYYLSRLRSGQFSKTEIITALYFSKERKKQNLIILGIKKRYALSLLYKLPLLGYIAKILFAIATLPKLIAHMRSYENTSYVKLETKPSNEAMHKLLDEKMDIKRYTDEEKYQFDTFYLQFEDAFRGNRFEIKKRIQAYLPYVEDLSFKKEDIRSLDVGCGRGEWLELLEENGYTNVKGVDLNRVMVAKSKECGLDVEEADVIDYLSTQNDNSLSLITGFHIIEHLPFEVLMKFFKECYRVLQKGGMIIFETPNPENIVVGACNFYTDPTHQNPIPPVTAEFLVQQHHFIQTSIVRLNLSKEAKYIEDERFSDLNDILFAFTKEQDYAIIGYKK